MYFGFTGSELVVYGCLIIFFAINGFMLWYAMYRNQESKKLIDDGWRLPPPSKRPPPPDS